MEARRTSAAIVAVALVLAGCGERQTGGGEEINACVGYVEYEGLAQPSPDEAEEVREFAEVFLRILDRVDPERRIVDRDGELVEVPGEVQQAYRTLEESLQRFRDRTRAASSDADEVRAAVNDLADDEAFSEADQVIAEFHRTTCSRGQ